jgi:hypothetical protein
MSQSGTEYPTLCTTDNSAERMIEELLCPTSNATCRFNLRKTSEGKPVIEMEMFHNTVPNLAAVTLSFEVLSGITIEQARDLIEKMNDQIVGVVLTPK